MNRETENSASSLPPTGDPDSAIWLLGDSNPTHCPDDLDLVSLDRRHPTRHNIWTPILDEIQRRLFRKCRGRLDDRKFYIRNAVGSPALKTNKQREEREEQIAVFRALMNEHEPFLILCFGQFAFEFALQARKEPGEESPEKWTRCVKDLAREFDNRVSAVQPGSVMNIIPLLHAIVARKFQKCHAEFSSGNGIYFEYVGREIAELIANSNHPKLVPLWM